MTSWSREEEMEGKDRLAVVIGSEGRIMGLKSPSMGTASWIISSIDVPSTGTNRFSGGLSRRDEACGTERPMRPITAFHVMENRKKKAKDRFKECLRSRCGSTGLR